MSEQMGVARIKRSAALGLLIFCGYLTTSPTCGLSKGMAYLDQNTGLEWRLGKSRKMNWPQAMAHCRGSILNSKDDWRLPSGSELRSAFKIKNQFPGITDDIYWSSTTAGKNAGLASAISFFKGKTYENDKRSLHLALCVRNIASVKDDESETLTDKKNGLTWQRWEPGEMKWQEAFDYCRQLTIEGKQDWRLPSKVELEKAYRIKREFPNAAASYYWSSTSNIANAKIAWCVYFGKPYVGYYDKSGYAFVRCVRGKIKR